MNKKINLNKLFTYIISSTLLFIFISSIYIFFPTLPQSIDNRLRDFFFLVRGEVEPKTNSIVIIDIDEKSIKSLGQWPWPRDILSQILQNLKKSDVGIIGMDIVFAEEDRSSPHNIFEKLKIKKDDIPNFDLEFAHTIASTPTILGYQFELVEKDFISKEAPSIKTIFIEKNKKVGEEFLIKAQGTILNLPLLRDNSYSSGFFNNIPDESGIVRSVPLIISYDETIYPSLALETLRIALGVKRVFINYNENGVENIKIGDISIPTDRFGRVLINFRGKEKSFKYISAVDIYNNNFQKEDINGKIALMGTSAAALMDLRATPFESIFPGVEVHANLIDNILFEDYLYMPSWLYTFNIFLILCLIIITTLIIKKSSLHFAPIAVIILCLFVVYTIYFVLFNNGIVINILFPITTIILTAVITLIIEFFDELKKKEAIKSKFASKVSKDVMEQLILNSDQNQLDSKNKEITIFFSDIRSFTKISEEINDPKKLIKFINTYMTPMSEIIIKKQGTIDKYIGDSIMAYWNAPFDVANHEDKAVDSAIEQLEQLEQLNKQFQKEGQPQIEIGIGITTGIATIGELGSIGRSDYTVIGDTVNIASRIESLCKYYNAALIISDTTKDRLSKEYNFQYLDFVKVKGKKEPIELWQIIPNINEDEKDNIKIYHKAINLYKNKNIQEALKIFNDLYIKSSNNRIYEIYKLRCEDYLDTGKFELIYTQENKS